MEIISASLGKQLRNWLKYDEPKSAVFTESPSSRLSSEKSSSFGECLHSDDLYISCKA